MKLVKLALLPALACSVPMRAQEAPRFAFFALEHVLENSAQAKRVFAEAEVLGKKLEEEIKTKTTELQRMEQQLNSSSISDEGKSRIARELEDGRTSLKRLQEDAQSQYSRVAQTALAQLNREILPIVEALAKEQKLNCVLNFNANLNPIAWADETWLWRFSQEVAKRYDAAYPGGGTAKPAAAPAATTKK